MRRATKSFSLDKDILAEVKRTKVTASESERVNSPLKLALERERRAALYEETGRFFSSHSRDLQEHEAYELANLISWTRG